MSCAAKLIAVRSTLCGQSPICAWLVKHVSARDMFVCFVMYLLVKVLCPTGKEKVHTWYAYIHIYCYIYIQQNGTVKTVIVPDKVMPYMMN